MRLRALDPLLYTDEQQLYTEFVDRFYEMLTTSVHPPYAISIDGLWGAGKTTIMRALHDKLESAHYPVFWFNPWKYRQTECVALAFLQSLYLTAANKDFVGEMSAKSATILHILLKSGLDAGLKIIGEGIVPPDVLIDDNNTAAQSLSWKACYEAITLLEREFADLTWSISRHHRRKPLMIFIDDLDRCRPADALQFLEAMKHLFMCSHRCRCMFICGLDTQIATQFVLTQYRGLSEHFAISYLRKIFHLTLSMPYSANLKSALLNHINEVYEPEGIAAADANALARLVYTRGMQTQLGSIRHYLNIITNVCAFQKFNPDYRFQPTDDLITTLMILREAWLPVYELLISEALHTRLTLAHLVNKILTRHSLPPEQRHFLRHYLGDGTPFARERLAAWIARHPTLA